MNHQSPSVGSFPVTPRRHGLKFSCLPLDYKFLCLSRCCISLPVTYYNKNNTNRFLDLYLERSRFRGILDIRERDQCAGDSWNFWEIWDLCNYFHIRRFSCVGDFYPFVGRNMRLSLTPHSACEGSVTPPHSQTQSGTSHGRTLGEISCGRRRPASLGSCHT